MYSSIDPKTVYPTADTAMPLDDDALSSPDRPSPFDRQWHANPYLFDSVTL
jgi:hypothetical protein